MAQLRDDRPRGILEAFEDGRVVGRIVYLALDAPKPALVAVHTVVEPAHEGKGIAGALVRELYAMAGREGVFVVPLCSYAAAWAGRHPGEALVAPAELVEAARAAVAAHPELA
ncbi:GNAT family N-acetyltransferase [Streptomyces sp. NPDC006660]|uniref:GNAT family N-acetyltransferase n=1 Tax=Streptomyces sp. NPDC006660 TaxID=3156901 RepID=UPI0033DD0191